jgi:hypothetical protein
MTSLVPQNCYRGILIPRKKTLVTSVTDQQTGYDLVKRFSMFNTVLDAGASPWVTSTPCDLRLTRPGKARYGTKSRPARARPSVFSEFYRKIRIARRHAAWAKGNMDFDNSYIWILGLFVKYAQAD